MKIYLCFIHDRFNFYYEELRRISAVMNKCVKDYVKFEPF